MAPTPTILDYALADEILSRSDSGRIALKSAQTQRQQQPSRKQEKPSTEDQVKGYLVDRAQDYVVENYIVDPALDMAGSYLGGAQSTAPVVAQNSGYMTDMGGNAIGSAWGSTAANTATSSAYPATTAMMNGTNTAMTIGASEAIPAGYEAIGTAVDGSTMIAPATESYLGAAMPYLGAAAGLYGMYQTLSADADRAHGQGRGALSGASSGAVIGTAIMPGVGTALGAILGGLAGFAHNKMGSRKGPEQLARDAGRKKFVEAGWLTPDYQTQLADGSMFDMGKDGGALLDNKGANIDGSMSRHYYDADFSDERTADTVASLDPLFDAMFGGNDKARSDWVGMHTNAALSSGDPNANVRAFYGRYAADPAELQKALDARLTSEKNPLAYDRYIQYINKLNQVYGAGGPR